MSTPGLLGDGPRRNGRLAPELAACRRAAGCALRQRDTSDLAYPEANRPAQPRHGRAGARRRVGVRVKCGATYRRPEVGGVANSRSDQFCVAVQVDAVEIDAPPSVCFSFIDPCIRPCPLTKATRPFSSMMKDAPGLDR